MKKLTLLWGLPGSGKTHYTEQIKDTRDTFVVNVDRMLKYYSGQKILDCVATEIMDNFYRKNCAVVDSLLTTNKSAKKIIAAVKENRTAPIYIEIIWWKEDRESCKWNDRGRRSVSSSITIDNIPFEIPDEKFLSSLGVNKIINRKVVRKPSWMVWAQENGLGKDEKMASNSWSLGGTSGSCWGDEKHILYPDTPPANFKKFDELLEELCPNITFMQYKKIYNECVGTEIASDSDYYGGSTQNAFFTCNLPKLYSMLTELALIKPLV